MCMVQVSVSQLQLLCSINNNFSVDTLVFASVLIIRDISLIT